MSAARTTKHGSFFPRKVNSTTDNAFISYCTESVSCLFVNVVRFHINLTCLGTIRLLSTKSATFVTRYFLHVNTTLRVRVCMRVCVCVCVHVHGTMHEG